MTTTKQHFNYDEAPYPDLSYTQTHPDRLAMLGKLLGMSPVPIEQCRVLEIGTAGGANLLPLAAVLPNSTFVGIDLSKVQIDQANVAREASGMTNITFHQMDIMDITPEFGQFDYIIAHGIYSWVPPVVQEKLLDVCKTNLSPQGIVYMSYNCYPGWHTMDIIRNIMLYRSRDAATPQEKSAEARQWISFMADALKNQPESAYAAVFQNYLNMRATQSEEFDHAALLHDELEVNNQPLYFYQFMEHAQQHGLQYLAESDFPTVMPYGLSDEVMEHLGEIAHDTIEMEQYMDFLRNRSFRRTLLCHAEVDVNRALSTEPVFEFSVSSIAHTVKVDADKAAKGIETFEGTDGAQFSTDHPLTKAAFHYLLDVKPQRIPFIQLARQAAASRNMTQVINQDAGVMAANLLHAFTYSLSLIQFHTFIPPMSMVVSERPLATTYARFQARHFPNIGNLTHGRVQLDNFSRLVLAQLDGQTNHAALLDFLVELVETGKISSPSIRSEPKSLEELRKMLGEQLEVTLQEFAELGLLMA